MDYTERLRHLAVSGAEGDRIAFQRDRSKSGEVTPRSIDPRTLALTRLAALVAMRGADPSFGEQIDDAIEAGASADEIVDVLVGVVPIVGLPGAVAAAPKIAMALGCPVDE